MNGNGPSAMRRCLSRKSGRMMRMCRPSHSSNFSVALTIFIGRTGVTIESRQRACQGATRIGRAVKMENPRLLGEQARVAWRLQTPGESLVLVIGRVFVQ